MSERSAGLSPTAFSHAPFRPARHASTPPRLACSLPLLLAGYWSEAALAEAVQVQSGGFVTDQGSEKPVKLGICAAGCGKGRPRVRPIWPGHKKRRIVNDCGAASIAAEDFSVSIYRKAFLIWWTALVLFIAVVTLSNLHDLPPGWPMGFLVVALCLLSWVPWRFAAWATSRS
jgi:hypothetical protein